MPEFSNSPDYTYDGVNDQHNRFLGEHAIGNDAELLPKTLAFRELQIILLPESNQEVKNILDIECRFLRINRNAPGWEQEFIEAHNVLMQDMAADFEKHVEDSIQKIPEVLAQNIIVERQTTQEVEDLLRKRLRNITTILQDPYRVPEEDVGHIAYSVPGDRTIILNGGWVLERLNDEDINTEVMQDFLDSIAQHEVLHLISGNLVHADEEDMTVGLVVVMPEDNHGTVLEEATIELFRTKYNAQNRRLVAYPPLVAFFSIAEELDPGFIDAAMKTLLFQEGRGDLVGRLESIFGPHIIEKVTEINEKYPNISDMEDFKNNIISIIPESIHELAEEKFATAKEDALSWGKGGW